MDALFASLDRAEAHLAKHAAPYYFGDHLTEADIRLYTTIVRFDPVYVQHFKCNIRDIRSGYPALHKWLRKLYWDVPAFRETTQFEHIKKHYTKSHKQINPFVSLLAQLSPWLGMRVLMQLHRYRASHRWDRIQTSYRKTKKSELLLRLLEQPINRHSKALCRCNDRRCVCGMSAITEACPLSRVHSSNVVSFTMEVFFFQHLSLDGTDKQLKTKG